LLSVSSDWLDNLDLGLGHDRVRVGLDQGFL
jgi:hypothetical protein